MAKVMIFIDGTWLYSNQKNLSETYGSKFHIDYGKLPSALGEIITDELSVQVDIVRTYLFGSNAKNYQPIDNDLVSKRKEFFDILKEEYHYEVEIYEIDYHKRRLRKEDRSLGDDFVPQEKCVDIALASKMMYFAAIPYAYDIAILVTGDKDFMPAIQHVRRLGKRIGIASIKKSCASEFKDLSDKNGLRDFDIIWLDEILSTIELRMERRPVECQSPLHNGERMVYTDEYVRKGRPFYCLACREKFKRQRDEYVNNHSDGDDLDDDENSFSVLATGDVVNGRIKKLMSTCGFVASGEGDFYFGLDDLAGDLTLFKLKEGDRVSFTVSKLPKRHKRGKEGNGNATEIKMLD